MIEMLKRGNNMQKIIQDLFPDWEDIKPGEWSKHNKFIDYSGGYGDKGKIEIGLYREPLNEDKEISGTYTLQIFDRDDVIVCRTVE